jgi:hypothetical protein
VEEVAFIGKNCKVLLWNPLLEALNDLCLILVLEVNEVVQLELVEMSINEPDLLPFHILKV